MGIELIIFDWSGVISDDRVPVYEAVARILRGYGKEPSPFDEFFRQANLTAEETLEKYGVPGNRRELFSLYKKSLNQVVAENILPKPYAGAHDTLQYIYQTGIACAVLSSHPTKNLGSEAVHYRIEQFFSAIMGDSKDKSIDLLRICEILEKNPRSTLFLGDTIYDVRAAKLVGVRSAAMCNGYHSRDLLEQENPEYMFDSLSELKNPELFR